MAIYTNRRYGMSWFGEVVVAEVLGELTRAEVKRRTEIVISRAKKVPCVNLREATGEHRPCYGCGNTHKTAEVHVCTIHGECSVTGPVMSAVYCLKCDDYEPTVRVQ